MPKPAATPSSPVVAGDTAIAPVVSYADPDPLPTGTAAGTRHQAGPRHQAVTRSGFLGALLALLAIAVALVLVVGHHGGHAAAGVPADAGGQLPVGHAARPRPLPADHGGLGPITLPGPEGNAPRTIPLDTVWIIDKNLPAADLTVVSREAPVDVTYLATYSLPEDELGFAFQSSALENIREHEGELTAAVARPVNILVAEPGQPIHLPPVTRGHNRAIVIITTDPSRWLNYLPTGPTPAAPTTHSRPGQSRTYVLDLVPSSGWHADPLTPSITQPQELIADPTLRGSTALALARAFVDATGAIWPG
jgi:hypothetical protein